MSDPLPQHQNRKQHRRQPRITGPRFTDEEKFNFSIMRYFREELENVKDEIRSAVVLEVKRAEGEILNEADIKAIDEKQLNMKVLDRLEAVYDKFDRKFKTKQRFQFLSDSDIWHLLHFFYIVRLSQQGFFHIVSAKFPYIEPQAITYLADQLISDSLYARQSVHIQTRVEHKDRTRIIIKKLRDRLEEPVGEGFKTTYKQIMEVVEQLTDMAFNEEEDRRKTEHNSNDENNTDDSHFNTSNINADSTSVTQPATQVWVLMPYTNMTDGNSVALPGMKPSTLPFPTELLQQMPFRNLPQLYPFKAVPLPSQQEPSNSTPTTANSTTAEPSQQTQEETVSSIERDEIEVNNNKISSSVSVISNGTSSEKPHTAEQKHQHELQSHLSPSASFTSSMYNKAALPSVAGNPATNTIENTAFEYSRPEEFEDIDADDSQYDDDQFADPDDEEQFADPDDDNKQAAIDNNSNWDQDAKSDNINNWETESKSSNVSNWEQKSKGYYRNWKQDVKANATTRSYIEGNRNRRASNNNDRRGEGKLNQWKNFAANHGQ